MSLRARLVLAAAYLLVVVVVALELPLGSAILERAEATYRSQVLSLGAIVASRISDDVARSGADPAVPPTPTQLINRTVRENAGTTRIIVVDALGRVLADSDGQAAVGENYLDGNRPELEAVFEGPTTRGTIVIEQRFSADLNQELLYVAVPVLNNGELTGAVRVSAPTAQLRESAVRNSLRLGVIGLGVILAGLALAWILAGSLAKPVRALERVALRVAAGDLEARAQPAGPKEVATLARSFNQMAASLSANLTAQQDFFANASHQLRTPLTGLRLRLEAIQDEGGFAAQQAQKAELELDRLSKLIEDLLELARASSVKDSGSTVELTDLAREAVDRWSATAQAAGKRMRLELDGASTVWASPADLGHVVDNLVENAIRYCPDGTEITVEAGSQDGVPRLVVSDDGPGIPLEDRERIFERFYRGSVGRRTAAGTGLGLAIVQELVERWGGSVRLSNRSGTCVEATFPKPPTVP
ncbi:MAG: HAMP domain-containing protein [Actinobacteria bacterium]|nr:HAMP domain-containing protein [Actinomycetota bacterium]